MCCAICDVTDRLLMCVFFHANIIKLASAASCKKYISANVKTDLRAGTFVIKNEFFMLFCSSRAYAVIKGSKAPRRNNF